MVVLPRPLHIPPNQVPVRGLRRAAALGIRGLGIGSAPCHGHRMARSAPKPACAPRPGNLRKRRNLFLKRTLSAHAASPAPRNPANPLTNNANCTASETASKFHIFSAWIEIGGCAFVMRRRNVRMRDLGLRRRHVQRRMSDRSSKVLPFRHVNAAMQHLGVRMRDLKVRWSYVKVREPYLHALMHRLG